MDKLGNCVDEELVNDIFGSVSEFGRQVEENGNNFIYQGIKIEYDPKTDIHTFYKLDKMLKELDYKDIFSPKTMEKLKKSSADSLKQMLGDKNFMQASMESMRLLQAAMKLEAPHKAKLEALAVDMVKKLFPIIDDNNIEIDAKLTEDVQIQIDGNEEEISINTPNIDDLVGNIPEEIKRRIINAVTQGSSIRGSFLFYMFKDSLDKISPELVKNYGALLKNAYGIYDDENAIAMMLSMLSQNQQTNGGSSEAVYDEDEGKFIIKARAMCFPVLIQEIIKGLYEIISLQGFTSDKEINQNIAKTVDKTTNEPTDIQMGKFIYDALNQLYIDAKVEDSRYREYFLAELYKLPANEFLEFVENAINGTLTNDDKLWVKNTFNAIKSDLNKDDSGLEDLD